MRHYFEVQPSSMQEEHVDGDDGQVGEGLRHGPMLYSAGQVEMRRMHGHTRTHAHSHRQDDRAGVWRHVAENRIGWRRKYRNHEATSRHPVGTRARLVMAGTQEWHPIHVAYKCYMNDVHAPTSSKTKHT
jgi:hypothetical protein